MNKKEIAEIKRRFKKESCTFTTMCGCYVDASKEKVVTFRETFLNLEDEEFHKYLEIAGKCLSGTLGNNLLELEFPIEEEAPGGHQQILMALRDSRLTDDNLVNAYYDLIIDTYDYVGNYLILLFHDAYDVPMKTKDNMDLGDSEEVYEYLLCAICPVTLSKPGLGYREAEHRIGARDRDWIVGATETGFTFPCFTERSTDIHSVLVYTKNAKEPHREFWENGLGCRSKQTTAEKQNAFTNMVTQALGPDDEETGEKILDIQQSLNEFVLAEEEKMDKDDPLPFTPEAVTEVLTEGGVPCGESGKNPEKLRGIFRGYPPRRQGTAGSEGSEGQRAPGGKESASGKGGGPDKEAGRGRRHRKRREGSRHRRQGFPRETASGYLRLCGRAPLSGHPPG